MTHKEAINKIVMLFDEERDNNPDMYLWCLGFEVVTMLHERHELVTNPKYLAPTLCGIHIIVDYENPETIKLYKECKGV